MLKGLPTTLRHTHGGFKKCMAYVVITNKPTCTASLKIGLGDNVQSHTNRPTSKFRPFWSSGRAQARGKYMGGVTFLFLNTCTDQMHGPNSAKWFKICESAKVVVPSGDYKFIPLLFWGVLHPKLTKFGTGIGFSKKMKM